MNGNVSLQVFTSLAVELTPGALLIAIGVLILTGQLTIIVRYLEPYLPVFYSLFRICSFRL